MGSKEILSDAEASLLSAAIGLAPGIARLIEGAMSGEPAAVRRVRDILPAKSASQAVADELLSKRR